MTAEEAPEVVGEVSALVVSEKEQSEKLSSWHRPKWLMEKDEAAALV